MTLPVPPIRPKTFLSIVTPWLTAIHKKDLLAVMSYPASDRQRRLGNLLDEPKTIAAFLPKSNTYLWIVLDFRVETIGTHYDLEHYILKKVRQQIKLDASDGEPFAEKLRILKKQTGKTIILASIGCEKLLDDKRTDLLTWIVLQQRLGLLRHIMYFESNLMDAEHIRFFGSVPTFLPRILTMSLYQKEDVMQFIRLKEHDWNFRVNPAMKEHIYDECGGTLLLVKGALRLIRDNPEATRSMIWNHIEMQFHLASLWHGFGPREQQVLQRIAQNLPLVDASLSPSIHYLLLTGFIRQQRNGFAITVPLFAKYIGHTTPKTYQFSLDQDSILLNGTMIDANFSKNEQLLLAALIRANGEIVTRTALAEILWPENRGEYSDWALDSIISRIRKKLGQLGVPPNIITVHKKQGIQLAMGATYER